MKTLHLLIITILAASTVLVAFETPQASAHIMLPYTIEFDQNYTDPQTHSLMTKDGKPFLKIPSSSKFVLPLIIKSEENTTISLSFHTTSINQFNSTVMPPGVDVEIRPESIVISDGNDHRIDVVIVVYDSAPDGTYEQNIVATYKDKGFYGSEVATIPFQINKGDPSTPFPPLKQYKFGIESEAVQCAYGMNLVIKLDKSPACVPPTSIKRLVAQGWTLSQNSTAQKIQTLFQSKILNKEIAYDKAQDYLGKHKFVINTLDNNTQVQMRLVYYITISFPRMDVNYNSGLPMAVMPWLDEYYQNPHWWTELEKDYLGMTSHRIEGGHVVWEIDYGWCSHCIENSPMVFVDAITGDIIDTKWLH
jgi:hypothetical protein